MSSADIGNRVNEAKLLQSEEVDEVAEKEETAVIGSANLVLRNPWDIEKSAFYVGGIVRSRRSLRKDEPFRDLLQRLENASLNQGNAEFPRKRISNDAEGMKSLQSIKISPLSPSTDIADTTCCPKCLKYLDDPFIVQECCHRYCGTCIEEEVGDKKGCMVCKSRVTSHRSYKRDEAFAKVLRML